MSIAPIILEKYPSLNEAQESIIAHVDGPLLVIAGPGSGKTFSLVLRTLNLLLSGHADVKDLVVCTFTEKAAFELRDRISSAALTLGFSGDLSELRVSTIHGLCSQIITRYRHRTELGSNYETLDDLTQLLFIFDNFDEIIGPDTDGKFLGRWSTRWTAIEGARSYFNKMTEELVDVEAVVSAADPFLSGIGLSYKAYCRCMYAANRVDFAHLQKLVHELFADRAVLDSIQESVRFAMVDEYQDTNYIQEQLLLRLVGQSGNLCVVGDEDQSLYRFRGATVRNILEFPSRLDSCRTLKLVTNYRSHEKIIGAYDRWMASADWSNPDGADFRFDKRIAADPECEFPEYPAVFAIRASTNADEAKRFAEMVRFLRSREVIADYNQVALLLHSVRQNHSGPYMQALEAQGIKSFCPRARGFFENEEIRYIVACFALIFGYHGEGRGEIRGAALSALADYVDECLVALARFCGATHPLSEVLRRFVAEIAALKPKEALDMRPADYLYQLLAYEPFTSLVRNENRARTLAIFSQLLNVFQGYYHYTVVTHRNREYMRYHLFNSFLRLLYSGGINEYEDPDLPFPKDHVQIMTIHQAKGLEFPVVVVGSLDRQLATSKKVDRDLGPFFHRPAFEPENRITLFDRMRLHYVAFSRPEKILVLTAGGQPKDHFATIYQDLPQWPYVQQDLLAAQSFDMKERIPLKKSYSFTGDLKLYETCPRQYQFFREYDFTPSRSAVIFFGLLVHQTIEDIHRIVMDGGLSTLNDGSIRDVFERTFRCLSMSDVRPIGETAKEAAFKQVMNYFRQNQDEMTRVVETEVDVSVEKGDYILRGKIDLLMGSDGRLELLDFKTSPRPADSDALLSSYRRQLCTYAHILERRYGKRPERLLLYWTAEASKAKAVMEFPYDPSEFDAAGRHFDEVVEKIRAEEFGVAAPPDAAICKECDLRSLCVAEGVLA